MRICVHVGTLLREMTVKTFLRVYTLFSQSCVPNIIGIYISEHFKQSYSHIKGFAGTKANYAGVKPC